VIGTSAAERPIMVYRFGNGPSKRLIVAGIHGGYEWNTVHLAEKMIDVLNEQPDMIPDQVTLYILPNLNPDGYARSRGIHGRANDNGVDLNRNFPALWQKNWPRQGCWSYLPISGGDQAASEPETQALIQFISSHDFEALISYHSAALGIFPGGQPPVPDSVALAEAVAHVSTYPYPPYDLGCKFTGQLIDWTASRGIPSLDIELANHQDLDWEQNARILEVFLTWEP
jgi:g-D-glutamyl-meso-diaminopimelate peptidase